MTKLLTTVLGTAALLSLGACSSEPSDFRPNRKVSVDAVAAGTRKTGLYPSEERADAATAHAEGHGSAHGEAHQQGEIHNADASESRATGDATQQSAVAEPATEQSTPAARAAEDSATEAKQ